MPLSGSLAFLDISTEVLCHVLTLVDAEGLASASQCCLVLQHLVPAAVEHRMRLLKATLSSLSLRLGEDKPGRATRAMHIIEKCRGFGSMWRCSFSATGSLLALHHHKQITILTSSWRH